MTAPVRAYCVVTKGGRLLPNFIHRKRHILQENDNRKFLHPGSKVVPVVITKVEKGSKR